MGAPASKRRGKDIEGLFQSFIKRSPKRPPHENRAGGLYPHSTAGLYGTLRSGTHTHIGGAVAPQRATATRMRQGKAPTPQGATSHRTQQGDPHRTQQGGSRTTAWEPCTGEPSPCASTASRLTRAAARAHEAFYRPLPCEAVSPPHARRLALRMRRLTVPCEPADSHDAPRSIDRATEGLYPKPARALPRRRRGLYLSRRNGFTRRLYPPLTTHGAPPKFC